MDGAEVEHDKTHRLVSLLVDDALDSPEQTVRRAKEDETGKPENVDTLALLVEEARLFRRTLDIA